MPDNFQEFDFNSSDPVQNLGIIFLFMMFLTALPILLWLMTLLVSCWDRGKRIVDRIKNESIYWNFYLRFTLEAYLELSIASILRVPA